METSQEVEMMKDGARRVQEFLAGKNIEVKHSVLLEALSAGFGARNWRTVREKLNAPSAPPKLTLKDLEGQRWTVHALYSDNAQPFSDDYPGENGLEAAVFAQVDRLMSKDSYEVDVASVIDRLTDDWVDHEMGLPSSKIAAHSEALYELAVWAMSLLEAPPDKSDVEAYSVWAKKRVSIEIFSESLNAKKEFAAGERWIIDALDGIGPYTHEEDKGFRQVVATPTVWTLKDDSAFEVSLRASEALNTVLDLVTKSGTSDLKVEHKMLVYHARALLEYAEEELNYVFRAFTE